MANCYANDWHLGPQVHHECRQFDFTLFFEATFLSALPSAILLTCSSVRLWQLATEPVKVHGGILLLFKLVSGRITGRSTVIFSTDFVFAD